MASTTIERRRVSLVNLYLHGFTDPHIDEYDTLTSEDRWNETADVILANPPFMSPKGGIKPHRRFSVQSKRSEVLFVDYIAEHLSPTGRAGIIVPEGIIFQSQGAYTELRKMLVEKHLVAVVSLPAGVFNPYSGVKTSVLILDRSLARQSDTIGFFKVENDGFGLGAQRRGIDKNDLPQVKSELDMYFAALQNRELIVEMLGHGLIVPKEEIAANGDYNLSLERYRAAVADPSSFPLVRLDEVFTKIGNGVNVTQIDKSAKYRVSRIQTIADGSVNLEKTKFTDDEVSAESILRPGDILLSHINSFDHLGKTAIFVGSDVDVVHGINLIRLVPDRGRIDPRFAIRVFKTDEFVDAVQSFAQKAVNQASVKTSDLRAIRIPLPPLEVQREIVAEIEGYQKVIDGARAVLDNYRPHIPIHPDWPTEALGSLFATRSGTTPLRSRTDYFDGGSIPWVKTLDLTDGPVRITDERITPEALADNRLTILPVGTVLVAMYGGFNQIGRTGVLEIEATHNQAMTALLPTPRVLPYYLNTVLVASKGYWKKVANSTRKDPNITKTDVMNFKLPVPPLDEQQNIVAEIQAEQALVAANRELIARFEKKIQATLARVWGEPTPAIEQPAPLEAVEA